MTKDERIILLDRELSEVSDLFRGVQALETIPHVLIDLMYQKAIHLAEGIEALKEEVTQVSVMPDPVVFESFTAVEDTFMPEQFKPVQSAVVAPLADELDLEASSAEEPVLEAKESIEKPYFEQIYRSHDVEKVVSAQKEDFRRLLTLNDRFFFQKELFRGDVGMMNYTIDQINQCEDLSAATDHLQKEFDWDTESESFALFHELLERHFK